MGSSDLSENLTFIVQALKEQGNKTTKIASSMGYTTTVQLNSVLEGKSILSTKAIIKLIDNLNVSPNFLFLGKGEIFNVGNSEQERLLKENEELRKWHSESIKDSLKFAEEKKRWEMKYNELLDITTAAIKYYKNIIEGYGEENEDKFFDKNK
jgi:transcriptional regulator with XRE-family HTH domain